MQSIFKTDKIPYFLTLLFAIIAIQYNYLFDSISKIPTLEYEFTTASDFYKKDTFYRKILTITNISRDKSIMDFHLQLNYVFKSRSKIIYPDIDAVPPAAIIKEDPKYSDDKLVYYPIKLIQPNCSYNLIYLTNTPETIPIISFACDQPINLTKKSTMTFFLKNQILVNFSIMLFFILLSIIYVIKLNKQ